MTAQPPRRISITSPPPKRTRRPRASRPLLPQILQLLAIIAFLVISYHALMWYWEWTDPREVAVPDVTGMTETEALRILTAAELRAEVVARRADENVPEECIIASDPPPGRMVKVGRLIRLTVSAGSRWTIVPDVREMSVDRARALLRQASLDIGRETAQHHANIPIGYVIGQAPAPDQRVLRGTEIDLLASKGPAPRIEPPPEQGPPGTRRTRIEYLVPPGADLQEVRIVVQDREGERTVYRNHHRPGETVAETVSGEGPGVIVRVYLSGLLVQEKPL